MAHSYEKVLVVGITKSKSRVFGVIVKNSEFLYVLYAPAVFFKNDLLILPFKIFPIKYPSHLLRDLPINLASDERLGRPGGFIFLTSV
jgi:hypothetical protein